MLGKWLLTFWKWFISLKWLLSGRGFLDWVNEFRHWKTARWEIALIILLPVLAFTVEEVPVLHNASSLLWDGLETLVRTDQAIANRGVRLVVITPEDYEKEFNATSPLDCHKLADLVAHALHGGAKKVFVDIETDHPSFIGLVEIIVQKRRDLGDEDQSSDTLISDTRKKVVWAVGAKQVHKAEGLPPEPAEGRFQLTSILGGTPEGQDNAALPFLQPDPDGRIRTIVKCFSIGPFPTRNFGFLGSFPVTAAEELRKPEELGWKPKDCPQESSGNPKDVGKGNYEDDFIEPGKEEAHPRFVPYLRAIKGSWVSLQDLLSDQANLNGSVVFLGGDYARDTFYMADGRPHPGVEVLAAATLALSDKQLNWHISPLGGIAIDILLTIVTSLACYLLRRHWGFVVGPTLALLFCIFLVWRTDFGGILGLAVIMLGQLIHHGISTAWKADEFEQELDELKRETIATHAAIS